jgi:hypothetical protein
LLCGQGFVQKNSLHKFCTPSHKDAYHSINYQNKLKALKKRCKHCGKAFITYKANQEYHNKACYLRAKQKRDSKRRFKSAV